MQKSFTGVPPIFGFQLIPDVVKWTTMDRHHRRQLRKNPVVKSLAFWNYDYIRQIDFYLRKSPRKTEEFDVCLKAWWAGRELKGTDRRTNCAWLRRARGGHGSQNAPGRCQTEWQKHEGCSIHCFLPLCFLGRHQNLRIFRLQLIRISEKNHILPSLYI